MSFDLVLMGLAVHTLIWEKLPDWGNWFLWLIARLPRPLAYLYEAWHCPFCFGFWIALALHSVTGISTVDSLTRMPDYLGLLATPIAWFLDALVTALLIMFANLCFNAIAVPAIKGYQMTIEFRKSMQESSAESA